MCLNKGIVSISELLILGRFIIGVNCGELEDLQIGNFVGEESCVILNLTEFCRPKYNPGSNVCE